MAVTAPVSSNSYISAARRRLMGAGGKAVMTVCSVKRSSEKRNVLFRQIRRIRFQTTFVWEESAVGAFLSARLLGCHLVHFLTGRAFFEHGVRFVN